MWWLWVACGTDECGKGAQCEPAGDDDDDATTELLGDAQVDTLVVDFGALGVRCPGTAILPLHNVGAGPLTVFGLDIRSDASGAFSVPTADRLPLTVPAGESFNLAIDAIVPAGGPVAGVLEIVTNEPGGVLDVGLAATGVWGSATQTFGVGRPSLDVMVLVDHSCSMEEQQRGQVEDAVPALLDALDAGFDWRLVLITAEDGCANGGVFDSGSRAAAEGWLVGHAFDGAGEIGVYLTEALLELGDIALSKTPAGQCNDDFLRAETPLQVIVVSDEREQSGESGTSWVRLYRDRVDDVVVSGAMDLRSACGDGSGPDGYLDAVEFTYGVSLDICLPWGRNAGRLVDAAPTTPGEVQVFALAEVPSGPPTEVRVDGAAAAEWTWDPAANAVTVEAAFAPTSVVDVDYPVPADCP